MAAVIHRGGSRFLDRYKNALTWPQVKVLNAIARCRTAALGGHRDQGTPVVIGPSHTTPVGTAIARSARPTLVINGFGRGNKKCCVTYYHLVFTVPHGLVPLMWQNKKALFTLLFEASGSGAALLEVAANPKHLGAEIGFLSVLHTWGQTLQTHPHITVSCQAGGYRLAMNAGFGHRATLLFS